MRCARGFTLIELLAAITVLAVLAALSFSSLSSMMQAEAHVREETRRWNEVVLLLAQLREDLSSSIEGRGLALGAAPGAQIILERFGEAPGMPPRRVGYRLRGDTVDYLLWSPLGAGSQPATHEVLRGVAKLRFTALGEDGTWRDVWPPGPHLPRAVGVELVLARGEGITRLYPLR